MVKNAFGIILSRFRVLLGDHGAKSKGFQRHCFYMFGVAQHAEDTPGQGRQDTNLIQWPYKMNRQCMCLMRTYVGALAGQDRT